MKNAWFVLALLWPVAALADFSEGVAAYGRGDYAAAVREWRPLAEQGHAGAQFNLGAMYNKGEGLAKDDAEAVKWWRMAAEQGHAIARNNLGAMYAFGYGVAKDEAEAARWYWLAAEQGYAAAQYNLGLIHTYGMGVRQNHVRGYVWFARAAAQGHVAALKQSNLLRAKMTPAQLAKVDSLSREPSLDAASHSGATTGEPRRYITNNKVSYRTGPGVQYQRLGVISAGREVQLETVAGEWLRVRLPDESTAYIHGDYAQPMTPAEIAGAR